MSHRLFLAICFVLFIFPVFAFDLMSQDISSKGKSRILVKMEGSDNFKEFGYSIMKSFEKAFGKNNLIIENDTISTMEVVLNIREVDNDKAAVSVLLFDPLPQQAIRQLKLEDESVKDFAKPDYLKQFKMLKKDYLKILNKNEIDEFTSEVAKDYI